MSTDVTTATAPQTEAEPDLIELATEITEVHRTVVGAAGDLANDVLYIGRLLLKAQVKVKAADLIWKYWVRDNLPLSERQASKYLKLARNPEAVTGDMTLKAALEAMAVSEGRELQSFSADRAIGKIVRLINKTLEDWPENERDGLTLLEKTLRDALKMTASIRNQK